MRCNVMKIERTVTTKALHLNQQMHKQTMTKLIMEKRAERETDTRTSTNIHSHSYAHIQCIVIQRTNIKTHRANQSVTYLFI